jgi:hypothetical protein
MKTAEIKIHVDPEVAMAYTSASQEDRCKMDMLVGFQLVEFLHSPESIEEVMAEMSREAMQHGLTSESLDSILHE